MERYQEIFGQAKINLEEMGKDAERRNRGFLIGSIIGAVATIAVATAGLAYIISSKTSQTRDDSNNVEQQLYQQEEPQQYTITEGDVLV
jgi:hypothetical protein